MTHPIFPALFALWLAACTAAVPGPAGTDLSQALVARTGDAAPALPEGACWGSLTSPAVFETVTTQVLASPERRAPDGRVTAPAAYRTETQHRQVAERRAFWFQTPCPAALTPELIASLQRALAARGLYTGPVTGALDAGTTEALRAWQRPRGLDSGVLALATARAFGLVPGELAAE